MKLFEIPLSYYRERNQVKNKETPKTKKPGMKWITKRYIIWGYEEGPRKYMRILLNHTNFKSMPVLLFT